MFKDAWLYYHNTYIYSRINIYSINLYIGTIATTIILVVL